MNKAKDFFISTLGKFGIVLYYAVTLLFAVAPFVILHIPPLIVGLVVVIIIFTGGIGVLINAVFWIWAFIVAVGGVQDIIVIIFYILFSINVLRIILCFFSVSKK